MAREVLVTSVAQENRKGMDAEILTAIAKRLLATLIIREDPFKRRLYLMKNGTIDLMVGLLNRPERENYIHFIYPPYMEHSDTVFFVPKGNAARIQTYADLSSLKIGTILGSKYFHQFDRDDTLNKEPVFGMVINFKKLLRGRLDTAILPEGAGIDQMHRMGIADKIELAQYRFSKKKAVYIGISKKSRLMNKMDEIEIVIGKMIQDKEIQKIIIAYYTRRNLPVPAH
jgi:polar amino acid transport system substrate-binding protein